ncbi:MAG: peptide/nickel transport system permease protein [Neolewinella sp.]
MLRYALKRLLYLPFSLLLLSMLCFGLRSITPGDPVEQLLNAEENRMSTNAPAVFDAIYRRAAANNGYNQPAFYFSVRNAALPDTLSRIARPTERKMLKALTLDSGNWPAVQGYYKALRRLAYLPDGSYKGLEELRPEARRLLLQSDAANVKKRVDNLPNHPATKDVVEKFNRIHSPSYRVNLLLPAFRWHGAKNQYHRWLGNILNGDFGSSLIDRQPVAKKLSLAIGRTALLNILALLLVFLISLPLGLYAAGYRGSLFDKVSTVGLFLLFGLPSFWIATLVANYFTTPAFGMDYFPSMGFGEVPDGASLWEAFSIRSSHLFLPVLSLAYPSWAYVSQHLRRSAVAEMDKAYVTTARLKGLSKNKILWGHVFRNASFPIITLLGGILPALLAGSILIERIFNLPGMGQLLYNSAVNRDWPVVIGLVLLNGILTAIGLLVADLAYAFTDPRVRLDATPEATTPVA